MEYFIHDDFESKTTAIIGEFFIKDAVVYHINNVDYLVNLGVLTERYKKVLTRFYELERGQENDLEYLSNHIEYSVRALVAFLSGDNEKLLRKLAGDDSGKVRKEVAKHDYVEILDYLSYDIFPTVRVEVAKHPHAEILKRLTRDSKWFVKHKAMETLNNL